MPTSESKSGLIADLNSCSGATRCNPFFSIDAVRRGTLGCILQTISIRESNIGLRNYALPLLAGSRSLSHTRCSTMAICLWETPATAHCEGAPFHHSPGLRALRAVLKRDEDEDFFVA